MAKDDFNKARAFRSVNNAAVGSVFPRAMIWMFGPDGRCWAVSKRWLEYRGATLEAERGDGWIQGLHPDDRESSLNTFRAAFSSRRVFQAQFRVLRADGSYAWVRGHGVPQYLNNGRFLGYSGELREIEEPAARTSDRQTREDSSNRLRGLPEPIAERGTENGSTKSSACPENHAQVTSADVRAQAGPDRALIHDLLNVAMAVQVVADLLEEECTSREECRECAKLLSRSAGQLLSEVERQRSMFDRAEADRALERPKAI